MCRPSVYAWPESDHEVRSAGNVANTLAKKRQDTDWTGIFAVLRGSANVERQMGKSASEKDSIPEKACTKCKHFIESGAREKGDGNCGVLRDGSDILADPPKFVIKGDVAYFTYYNVDASKCTYYVPMEFVDHDISECADPRYTRGQRATMK